MTDMDRVIKKKARKIIFICQAIALVFLVLRFCCALLANNGYDIFLFGKASLDTIHTTMLFLAVMTEIVMFVILAVVRRKLLLSLPVLLALPVILLYLFSISFVMVQSNPEVYSYDEFDQDILIIDYRFLLAGNTIVYETENGILIKKVASFSGDDGIPPWRELTVVENGILIEHDGFEDDIYLEYREGHFCNSDSSSTEIIK